MAKVLVTETDSALGATLAAGLAQDGHMVAACSASGAWPDGATDDLDIEPVCLDLSEDDVALDAGLAHIRQVFSGLDWIVLTGSSGPLFPLELLSTAALDKIVSVNLTGPIRLLQRVIPDLRQSADGRVLAISSLASVSGLPASGACCAARSGLEAALESLRYELLPDGTEVSVIQTASTVTTIGVDDLNVESDSFYRPLLDAASEVREQASRWVSDDLVLDQARRILEDDHPDFGHPLGPYAALACEVRAGEVDPAEIVGGLYRLDEWLGQLGSRPNRAG